MTRWLDELMVADDAEGFFKPYAKTVEGLRRSHGTSVFDLSL